MSVFLPAICTTHRHDRQHALPDLMTFTQDENTNLDQTSYLLGGRAIEMITATRLEEPTPSGLSLPKSSFPIYDGYGNMIATLAKNGTSFTLANEKKYDVWGAVRSSSGAGTHIVNPNKQYCANLGHTWDGESGLIYMRARYYEPSTGRFIREDPARDGLNWYSYAACNPTSFNDPSGLTSDLVRIGHIIGVLSWIVGVTSAVWAANSVTLAKVSPTKKIKKAMWKAAQAQAKTAVWAFTIAFAGVDGTDGVPALLFAGGFAWADNAILKKMSGLYSGAATHGHKAVKALFLYALVVMGALLAAIIVE